MAPPGIEPRSSTPKADKDQGTGRQNSESGTEGWWVYWGRDEERRSDRLENSGSTASDSPSGATQTVNIFLLQSDDTSDTSSSKWFSGTSNNDAVSCTYVFSQPPCCKHATCLPGYKESDCQVVWEKKLMPEEEKKAKSQQLPHHFFCGLSTTDNDSDHNKSEDFETEVRKDAQLNKAEKVSSSAAEETSDASSSSAEAADGSSTIENQTSDHPTDTQSEAPSSMSPTDLSTKKSPEPESNAGTATATTATTASQGIVHFLFFTTEV
ncbi:uncharacterized protein [Thunnus thynnus]|uniref:uncharacterized protein n=1 Tax=Thunnus thynnus TaxID=8237 RepID=UPI003528C239